LGKKKYIMPKIDLSGTIGSLLDFYKHERSIFGCCPHCQEPFRLSEVKLTYGKEPPNDLLSRLKKERANLADKLDALEAEIEEIEEQHSEELETVDAKWKDHIELEVTKATGKREREIRQKAIAKSRAGQLGKTLEKIIPMFPGFGHHPYDVRPVFDPIDFVVFDGYYQGKVTDICFVEFKTGQSRISPVQGSIRDTIEKKRVRFEEKRLGKEAVKMLTEGKISQTHRFFAK
jgi:predicted Holliday junction resolvase-like endonuclease